MASSDGGGGSTGSSVNFQKSLLRRSSLRFVNVLRIGLLSDPLPVEERLSRQRSMSPQRWPRESGEREGPVLSMPSSLRSPARKRKFPIPEFDQDPALHIAVVQSHPLWLVRRWIEEMGVEETMQICSRQIIGFLPFTLRTNTLKIDREDLIIKLQEKGLNPSPTPFSEEGIGWGIRLRPSSELPFLKEGLYIIQDEASQLVDIDPGSETREKDPRCLRCPRRKDNSYRPADGKPGRDLCHGYRAGRNWVLIEEGCQRLGIKIVKT